MADLVKKVTQDADLTKLVNQMIGLEDPDPAIVVPRYRRIHSYSMEILSLLEKFVTSPLGRTFGPTYPANFAEILSFVEASKNVLVPLALQENDKTFSGAELKAINADRSKLAELMTQADETYKIAGLGEKFNNLKSCSVVQNFILLTRNIKGAVSLEKERRKAATHDLEAKGSLGDGFIVNSDGDTLELFPFSKLNFKSMMNSDRMSADLRQYTLYWLHLVYNKCLTIAEDVTSPPIDIDLFANAMVDNISKLDGQIPRCKEAFDMIKNSVNLLKGNFRGYYRDFLSAGTPTVIVEHFLGDVAKNNKGNAKATFQFRQIWKHYSQKIEARGVKDPRIKKMLSMLGSNLDVLEEKPKTAKKPELSEDNIMDGSDEEPESRKEKPTQLEGVDVDSPSGSPSVPNLGKQEKGVGKAKPKTPVADPQSPAPTSLETPPLKPVLKKKAAGRKK